MKILPLKLDNDLHLQLQLAASIAGKGRAEFVIDLLRTALKKESKP